MFDYIDFTPHISSEKKGNLKLLALSTCGFCKKAMRFLEENGISYEMVYIDELEEGTKAKVKEEFKSKFNTRLSYPTLVINEEDILTGFIEPSWTHTLLG